MKTLLLIGVLIVLSALSIGGALWLFNTISGSDKESTSSHESTSASHSGPSNLSEALVQDLTRLKEVNVSIVGADFKPNNIHIKKGTKVVWTNNATESHAVMKENGNNDSHASVSKDEVREDELAGPTLSKDKTYEFTFNTVQQVYYHCPLHPNIRGKVTVVE